MLIRPYLVPAALVLAILLTSCDVSTDSGPSMTPIGDGLRFLGVALVVAVLVAVLGLSRSGGGRHG